jgi:hypothetical protein
LLLLQVADKLGQRLAFDRPVEFHHGLLQVREVHALGLNLIS